jgi:predicted ATPase
MRVVTPVYALNRPSRDRTHHLLLPVEKEDKSASGRCCCKSPSSYEARNNDLSAVFTCRAAVPLHRFPARVLWLQGFSDQAVRTAEISIAEAQATGHAISLCYALALAACPIAFWVGNLAAAAHYTGMLLDHSRQHSLAHWAAFGSRFQRVVILKGSDLDTGSRLLRTGLDEIAVPNFSFRSLTGLCELAEALARAGRIAEGLAVSEAGWLTPELLRLKDELFLLQSSHAVAETAADLFRQALDGVRRQETLSWELRAATSLARLLRNQCHPSDAMAVLQPVYDRFTEGFGTVDLQAAKQLLDELSVPPIERT